MFSVIIPLYNKTEYIEKCLISVFYQTCQEFEVIVVNDGSTDDGADKVQEMMESQMYLAEKKKPEELITHLLVDNKGQQRQANIKQQNDIILINKPRIKLINQLNSGVSTARNNGVKEAVYDYIAFLDADDWWESTYLEEMKKLIEDFPSAGIYGCNYFLVKNGKKKIANIGVDTSFKKGVINYCLVYAKTLNMPLWTGATIIPKRIFELENGFNPNLMLGEDFNLWIRVALKYPVVFLNTPLSNYNQDVSHMKRAVGNLYNPENHMLWNLDFLANEEHTYPDFKQLIDNLRVYILFPYYISNKFHEKAKRELKRVNWSNQPLSQRIKYTIPVNLLKFWYGILIAGSKLKQKLL